MKILLATANGLSIINDDADKYAGELIDARLFVYGLRDIWEWESLATPATTEAVELVRQAGHAITMLWHARVD